MQILVLKMNLYQENSLKKLHRKKVFNKNIDLKRNWF